MQWKDRVLLNLDYEKYEYVNKCKLWKNPIGMKFPKGFKKKKIKLNPKQEPTGHRYSHGCVSVGGSASC